MGIISALFNEKNVLEMSLGDKLIWQLDTTEELNFAYPFNQASTKNIDLTNAIVNGSYSFIVDDSLEKLKSNSNYNVNESLCFSYIKINVPPEKTASITIDYEVSSESSYDIGCAYYTTNISSYPTASQCKASNFTLGTRIFYKSGIGSGVESFDLPSLTNVSDTIYYLVYGYAKDVSMNKNDDRFYINSINIKIE